MNRRLTRRAAAASAFGLVSAAALHRVNAHEATPEASPIPAAALTPSGLQLTWIISIVNGDLPVPDISEIESRFSDDFLSQFPSDQLQVLFAQFKRDGAPFTVEGVIGIPTDLATDILVTIKDGSQLVISIVVEEAEPHRISTLLFQPYQAPPDEIPPLKNWEELESGLEIASPNYSIYAAEVLPNGESQPIHTVNETRFFAIGSAFKFYVLGAVAQKIAAGEATWDRELEVTDRSKSFPAGVTQNELPGSMIAIEELANRMIAISDNTATDMLFDFAGRDAVETALATLGHSDPSKTIPMIKTKEMFLLKLSGDAERLSAYASGDVVIRREILAEMIDESLPDASDIVTWTAPISIDTIEWFATMPDLARAMVWLWNEAEKPGLEPIRSVLTLSPGVPFDETVWSKVAFKGGSEVGVMALSWLLERNDGRTFTFACVVNNPDAAIPEQDVAIAAAGAFALLEIA